MVDIKLFYALKTDTDVDITLCFLPTFLANLESCPMVKKIFHSPLA